MENKTKYKNLKLTRSSIWTVIMVGIVLLLTYIIIPLTVNNQGSEEQQGVGAGPADIIGKQIRLSQIPIQSIVSERMFWVGPDETQRVLVLLDNDTISQDRSDFNSGDKVTVTAVIKNVPPEQEINGTLQLDDKEKNTLQDQEIYLQAKSVTNDINEE